MPAEALTHPEFGLSAKERVEQEADRFLESLGLQSPGVTPGTLDCLKVHHAIVRGDHYVVEASTPGMNVMIRFAPKLPLEGEYEIHSPPTRPTEKGTTSIVKQITGDELDKVIPVLLALRDLPFRFVVITNARDRSKSRKGWVIGVSAFQSVDEIQNQPVNDQSYENS